MVDTSQFLRLAVDPVRLAVLGRAAEGPVDVEAVAGALGVAVRDIRLAVFRLREGGLLTESLELDRDALRSIATRLQAAPIDRGLFGDQWSSDEVEILARFVQGMRLTSIPSSRSKRRVVLEWLAQEFVPGIRYPERHVNATLRPFHEDVAALRRYMVDEGLLSRAEGFYWRTGGRVDVGDDGADTGRDSH